MKFDKTLFIFGIILLCFLNSYDNGIIFFDINHDTWLFFILTRNSFVLQIQSDDTNCPSFMDTINLFSIFHIIFLLAALWIQ